MRVPPGRAETGERRYHENAASRVGPGGERGAVGSVPRDPEAVAKPLDGGAGVEDRAFERPGGAVREFIGQRGQQAIPRDRGLGSGMGHREGARAVGAFHRAGGEAAPTGERRVPVARHRRDRDRAARQVAFGVPEPARGVADFGQRCARDAEEVERLVGPGETADVEQGGARGVGRVGRVDPPAGETPEEETVDGPERQGAAALRGQRIEQPAQFGGGEIRVGDEPGNAADGVAAPVPRQLVAERGGPPVLPDDGVVQRLSGRAVPDKGGFALVGDADGGDMGGVGAACGAGLAQARRGAAPDVLGVLLHPAGARIDRLDGAARHGAAAPPRIEDDGAGGGRALVEDEYRFVTGHRRFSLWRWTCLPGSAGVYVFARFARMPARRPPHPRGQACSQGRLRPVCRIAPGKMRTADGPSATSASRTHWRIGVIERVKKFGTPHK